MKDLSYEINLLIQNIEFFVYYENILPGETVKGYLKTLEMIKHWKPHENKRDTLLKIEHSLITKIRETNQKMIIQNLSGLRDSSKIEEK